VSLANQSGTALFTPYTISYKHFKTGFFHVVIKLTSHKYFYYGDVPKFPFIGRVTRCITCVGWGHQWPM